ncbi:MAG: tRNA sulfurtransferase [Desulfurococcaceae archaeon]
MAGLPAYLVTVAGELPLKSDRSRPRFYKRLIENLKDALSREGIRVVECRVVDAKIYLSTDKEALSAISRVFGVHSAGRVLEYEFRELKDLAEWISENAKAMVSGRKFAVRVKRSGDHPFTSLDVAREAGALLKPHSAGVDLENPEVVVEVEVRGHKAYLYVERAEGPKGLPVGVEGSALVLFSGGFDSPVAAWLSAKRGIRVDFLHYIMGSTQISYNAFLVAKELASKWLHGYRPLFISVDFRDVIAEVSEKVEWSFRQVVLRALMYIVAARIARERGYDALVTGESIGQASSQTLKNLVSIEAVANTGIPVLRPLLGFDKEEIIELSRKIGLYELSSRVAEACAIAPSRVETRADPAELKKQLERVSASVIDKALSTMRVVDLLSASPEDAVLPSDVEIDFIPSGALVIDARGRAERVEAPLHGAVPLEEVDFENLPRDRVIVVVCETGSVSYVIAKELRDRGYKAYSLKHGLKGCKLPATS